MLKYKNVKILLIGILKSLALFSISDKQAFPAARTESLFSLVYSLHHQKGKSYTFEHFKKAALKSTF